MSEIIFIPTLSGGYYVDRSKATIVCRGGYGRLEFDLSDNEQDELEGEVWGDEADLVFPGVERDWADCIKSLRNHSRHFSPVITKVIFQIISHPEHRQLLQHGIAAERRVLVALRHFPHGTLNQQN